MNWGDSRLPERFWSRVAPCPMSGCWLWTGTAVAGGYGRTKIGERSVLVHRLTVQVERGIPDGMVIDHKCRVTCCVNPQHLEAVSQQINVLRGIGIAAMRAKKTHCVHGHELAGDNLRVFERSPGRFMRTCLACERAIGVRRRKKAS